MTSPGNASEDLVERLEMIPLSACGIAAKEITSLRAQLAAARKALEPFARLADAYDEAHLNRIRMYRDEGRTDPRPHSDGHRVSVSMGELRAAQSALYSLDGGGKCGDLNVSAIHEQISEGDGFWRSCSGCYETEDGQNVHGYPHSEVFGCILGSGCGECGGIGAIWDTTDYAAMGEELAAEMNAPDGGGK